MVKTLSDGNMLTDLSRQILSLSSYYQMCATSFWWRHLVNACEVKARPDRIVEKLGAVCFWQPTPSSVISK